MANEFYSDLYFIGKLNYETIATSASGSSTDTATTMVDENVVSVNVKKTPHSVKFKDGEDIIATFDGSKETIVNLPTKRFSSIVKKSDYVYEIEYDQDELDYNYAYKYFKNEIGDIPVSGCSSVRNGNWFGRNFDWEYNEDATFIIHVNGVLHRSVGVATLAGLTNNMAEKDTDSALYKALPFSTLDGINDAGVFVNTNVVPLDYPQTSSEDVEGKLNISMKMLPRYILDHFSTAQEAVEFMKNDCHIFFPKYLADKHFEMHMMVGDESVTYIVEVLRNEFGESYVEAKQTTTPIMTNFYLNNITLNEDGSVYTPYTQDLTQDPPIDAITTNGITQYGVGLERFNQINASYSNLNSRENMRDMMSSIFATRPYTDEIGENYLYTEYTHTPKSLETPDDLLKVNSEPSEFETVIDIGREVFANRSRDKHSEYYGTWQTTHSAVYDIENRNLYLVCQENTDIEYAFHLQKDYTAEEIDALLAKKEDLITESNKVPSDFVDDTNQTHKFVTPQDKQILESAIANQGIAYGTSISWDGSYEGRDYFTISSGELNVDFVRVSDTFISQDELLGKMIQTSGGVIASDPITECRKFSDIIPISSGDGSKIIYATAYLSSASEYGDLSANILSSQEDQSVTFTLGEDSQTVDFKQGIYFCYFRFAQAPNLNYYVSDMSSKGLIISDNITDADQTNKFVTTEEKSIWNAKSVVIASETEVADAPTAKSLTIDGTSWNIGGGMAGSIKIRATDWTNNTYIAEFDNLGDKDCIIFSPKTKTDMNEIRANHLFVEANGNSVTFTVDTTPTSNISLNWLITKSTEDEPDEPAGLYDGENLLVSWEDSGIDSTCSNASTIIATYENCNRVVISDDVTTIGEMAFASCVGLTSVKIPKSVTSIVYGAFYGCTGLTSITIPGSVTSIGSAFPDCTGLTSVTIENGVTSIGMLAFSTCTSLTSITIPSSVTSIDSYAFAACTSLASITIGSGVTTIGEGAFSGCGVLSSIVVSEQNPVYHSAGNCLIETATETLILGCNNSIIPTDGNVTSIGNLAFGGCSELASITIPDSVTRIGEYAFQECSFLTSITIGNGVTSIGEGAFADCSSLNAVYITDLAKWCSISFASGSYDANPLYYAHNLYLNNVLVTNLVIPEGVTSIGSYAFCYCTSLTSATIGNSVTSIDHDAFYACTGLTSVTIEGDVTSIGYSAFESCSGLASITIPDSMESIGSYAFASCTSLTSIIFNGTQAQWNAISKSHNWNSSTGAYTIHCTDGDIPKGA